MVGFMKVLGLLTWSLNEWSDFQQDNVEVLSSSIMFGSQNMI